MLYIRVLEWVDRTILSFVDVNHERSSRSSDIRLMSSYNRYLGGHSLKGKTTILRIVNLGSIPGVSTKNVIHINFTYVNRKQIYTLKVREAQFGRAEH